MDLQSEAIIFNAASSFTNFEIKKYSQNGTRFNGVYSKDNLPDKVKNGAHVINLDEYSDIGAHTYFDSFWVEHIPKKIKIFIDKSIVVLNIFRIQAFDSVMCGYFCIGFIDFMLAGKTSTDFTNRSWQHKTLNC